MTEKQTSILKAEQNKLNKRIESIDILANEAHALMWKLIKKLNNEIYKHGGDKREDVIAAGDYAKKIDRLYKEKSGINRRLSKLRIELKV